MRQSLVRQLFAQGHAAADAGRRRITDVFKGIFYANNPQGVGRR